MAVENTIEHQVGIMSLSFCLLKLRRISLQITLYTKRNFRTVNSLATTLLKYGYTGTTRRPVIKLTTNTKRLVIPKFRFSKVESLIVL